MPESTSKNEVVPEVHCAFPQHDIVKGNHVELLPLNIDHVDELFENTCGTSDVTRYDYLPYGPFTDINSYREHMAGFAAAKDPQFYAIRDLSSRSLLGHIAFLRVESKNRVIEIGHVLYGKGLQRTVGATEAFYLLANKAFEADYRRLEWKCNANNAASKRAALRFGHTFEGVFRQHMIVKGLNRDSAWFSILDKEWPSCKAAFLEWLSPDNFDQLGQQKTDLISMRESMTARFGTEH